MKEGNKERRETEERKREANSVMVTVRKGLSYSCSDVGTIVPKHEY